MAVIFKRDFKQKSMTLKTNCQCTDCSCTEKFEIIKTEELLNLIQHGRLNGKQIEFLKTRVDSKKCKNCHVGNHYK